MVKATQVFTPTDVPTVTYVERTTKNYEEELRLMGWRRPFDDAVPLPNGKQLVTLEDAARHIQRLPKAEQQRAHWATRC